MHEFIDQLNTVLLKNIRWFVADKLFMKDSKTKFMVFR